MCDALALRSWSDMARWWSRNVLRIYAVLALGYLLLPVAYTLAFSFNDAGKSNLIWKGFTLRAWQGICDAPDVCSAVRNSLIVGLLATLLATVLGTMIAFALGRHQFRGRSATNLLIFLPMATPEVVLGSSLLALFVNMGGGLLGFPAVLLAHVMFCISFVVVTVKARIASLDPRLEEAARDLYADERQTFMKVTLPLVMPGIAAAALLSFSLSFDDVIITNFNSGSNFTTFPKFIWTSSLRGIPPQANVIASLMFAVALAAVVIGQINTARRAKGLIA
ncbi:MAG: ABC transporter permease [Actinobacteria bacterium]|nr:ABC transporter permease [Actinomycetota bacterium]